MAVTTLPAVTGYRFSIAQYAKMIESGIFWGDERIELIDGEVFTLAPMGNRHASSVGRLIILFTERFRDLANVTSQTPVALGDHSEPQPDLLLLKPRADFYTEALPTPADVYLLIEVSDSTLTFDNTVKLPQYAGANVPEVWILDLEGRTLTTYHDPSPNGYRVIRTVRRGDILAPLAFSDREIAVVDILG